MKGCFYPECRKFGTCQRPTKCWKEVGSSGVLADAIFSKYPSSDEAFCGVPAETNPPIPLPEEGFLLFRIDLSNINHLQVESLRRAIKRAKAAHFTDLDIRINGKNERIEADWLKHFEEVT